MTHKILLADDSVTIRKVVELTFSDEDFTIVSVGDGSQALERARSERPDIVISDVIMPGLNGYELCQQLKSDPALQSIPFLFLKGTFESFDEQKAQSCGADGFIVKPFESQEMIARVKDMIASGPAARAVPAAAGRTAPPARPVPAAISVPAQPAPQPIAPVTPPRPAPPAYPAAVPAAAAPPPPAPPPAPPPPAAMPRVAPPAGPRAPATPQPFEVPPVMPPPRSAPPPVPPLSAAARPVPPAVPPAPVRIVPPPPPRPERPFVPPPPPPPPAPERETIPFAPAPEAPSMAFAPPQPQPPAPSVEEFGFDFGETETSRPTTGTEPARPATEAIPEQSGETDEDLWSEVSLRDRGGDLLESPGSGAPQQWDDGGAVALAGEVAAADESAFDEVSDARPFFETAPPVEEFEDFAPEPAAPVAVKIEEPSREAPQEPAAAEGPRVGAEVDEAAIERLVAARVEAAVRKVLEPLVNDLARGMVESIAWDVIPELAEAMIRTEIERIRQSATTD